MRPSVCRKLGPWVGLMELSMFTAHADLQDCSNSFTADSSTCQSVLSEVLIGPITTALTNALAGAMPSIRGVQGADHTWPAVEASHIPVYLRTASGKSVVMPSSSSLRSRLRA